MKLCRYRIKDFADKAGAVLVSVSNPALWPTEITSEDFSRSHFLGRRKCLYLKEQSPSATNQSAPATRNILNGWLLCHAASVESLVCKCITCYEPIQDEVQGARLGTSLSFRFAIIITRNYTKMAMKTFTLRHIT